VRGDILIILQQAIVIPQAWNGAFFTPPIGDGMEVCGISIPLKYAILAASLPPEKLFTLVDLHKGVLQGVPMCPFISRKAH
jgi:hypothetical protein